MSIQSILKRLPGKIQKLFNAGKDAEWSAFWDAYQQNGKRNSWNYAFYGNQWNDITFKPKYNIAFATGTNNYTDIFRQASFTDLKGLLEKQGVTLDTSGCSGSNPIALFYQCYYLTRVPTLDLSNLPNGVSQLFASCSRLQYVEKLILSENGTTFISQSFQGCKALEEIRFEGKIASDINFGDCQNLSAESIESIVNALSDTATGMTCYFYLTSRIVEKDNETDNTWWSNLIATKPNWRISFV